MSSGATSVNIRQINLIEREILSEAGIPADRPTRHIVVGAVFENPFAGKGAASAEDLARLAEISVEVGTILTTTHTSAVSGNGSLRRRRPNAGRGPVSLDEAQRRSSTGSINRLLRDQICASQTLFSWHHHSVSR